MLYRGTTRASGWLKIATKAAYKTRATVVVAITPPARIAGLCSTDNSVFRCGGVENNHLRLPLLELCGLKQRELCIFRHVVTHAVARRHRLPVQKEKNATRCIDWVVAAAL